MVDQPGRILVLEGEVVRDEPFLDIRDRVVDLKWGHDERGLLGLAFHPDYEQNGRFYVRYSAPRRQGTPEDWDHTEVLSEFTATADERTVDPDTERTILEHPHPHLHHNAGDIAFGPDGYLYLGLGDGGHTGDVGHGHVDGGNGQDITENLMGSILRIDVDRKVGDRPYAVPEDNPLVDEDGLDEHYAWGLRNPWRFSFDEDGRLFVADVGEHLLEWVNLVEKGGNYGWNITEGSHCFDPENQWEPPEDCPNVNDRGEKLRDPIVEYPHIDGVTGAGEFIGSAVVGGHVYEGDSLPDLKGSYVFGDLSKKYDAPRGRLFAARPGDGDDWNLEPLGIAGIDANVVDDYVFAFGRDHDGELYVLTSRYLNTRKERQGTVYKVVPPEESEVSGPEYGRFDAASDAYWYSLYNMNNIFVRSGNGLVFPFHEEQFDALSQEIKAVMKGVMQRAKFMMRRKQILDNSPRADELPVKNPHLIVAPFTTGDPHFTQEPDAIGRNMGARPDADTFRWDREKSSGVISPAAMGWTHLKGVTWAKSFEHEFDLAPIAKRHRPQILGTAAQLGIKYALQNGHLLANPDDDEDMRLIGAYRPADDEVVDETASPDDYAAMLWFLSDMVSFAENGWFGYENPSPMIDVDEIQDLTDQMATTTFRECTPDDVLDDGTTRDLGVLLGATGWYGTHAGDDQLRADAAAYANDLADTVKSHIDESGHVEGGAANQAATQGIVSQGLLWASQIDGVDRERAAVPVLTYLIDDLWDEDAGTFATGHGATTYTYTPRDAGDIVGGLNAAVAVTGIDEIEDRYATYFNQTFNRGRLQRATRWQAYRPEGEHPVPLEANAGGEHGQAAVYNAEIEYDTAEDEWTVTDDMFHTSGSLYLANQDLWASIWGGSEFPGRGVPSECDRLPRWEDERGGGE
ncbi:PQQ-dependent sugar dehydrogenase [Natrinema sp. 74]|uniref:PQQ-dependent sugar dehydrogenase n=1 Tax=Natrinema sp. 74 TaxID=3384159 RepID=UPI0038D4DA95